MCYLKYLALAFSLSIKCGGILILLKLAIILFPHRMRKQSPKHTDGLLKVTCPLLQKFDSNPTPLILLVLYSTIPPLNTILQKGPSLDVYDKYRTLH